MFLQLRKNIRADAMAIVLIVLHIMAIDTEDGTMVMLINTVANLVAMAEQKVNVIETKMKKALDSK